MGSGMVQDLRSCKIGLQGFGAFGLEGLGGAYVGLYVFELL